MLNTVEEVILKIEMTPYVKERLKSKLEVIEGKNLYCLEELRQIMNFICPNLIKLIKKPRRDAYRSVDSYINACSCYEYENSQCEFPYTKENLEELKKYIKEIV